MNALSLSPQDPQPNLEPREQRERKYLPEAEAARAFWRVATAHLRPEHDGGEVAYTRTTYFDTADLTYYRSSRGPIKRRLRVREYAVASDPDQPPVLSGRCYLELKKSAGTLRTKKRVEVRHEDLAAQLTNWSVAPLTPCVATWYRRRALIDADDRLRVTLDDRVLLCRPRAIGSAFSDLETNDVLAHGPSFVLECKNSETPPAWLKRALAGLHEVIGFSKFVLGMNAVVKAGVTSRTRRLPVAAL